MTETVALYQPPSPRRHAQILLGWNEIAQYLRCSLRTAKKYHYEGQMPLIRGIGFQVRALPEQLDAWLVGYSQMVGRVKWKGKQPAANHCNIHTERLASERATQ
jgi:hypothetical protein